MNSNGRNFEQPNSDDVQVVGEQKIHQDQSGESLRKSAEYYRSLFDYHQKGPQKEGLSAKEVIESLQDPDTVSIYIESEKGEDLKLPLFVPLRYNEWLSESFFTNKFGRDREVMYMSNVPGLYEDQASLDQVASAIESLDERGVVIVTEHFYVDSDPMLKLKPVVEAVNVDYVHHSLTDSDELAGEWHYVGATESFNEVSGEVKSLTSAYQEGVEAGRYPYIANDGTGIKIINSIEEEEEINRLWRLYEGPFRYLAETNPVRASFTYYEFVDAMRDSDVIKSVYQEDGDIVAFCFLQNNLELCPWINQEYYKSRFPKEYRYGEIIYFPGIVTDDERRGGRYSGKVINMITDLVYDSGQEPVIIFECNDVSRHYIPKIVERAVNSSNKCQINVQETGAHLYQAVELKGL